MSRRNDIIEALYLSKDIDDAISKMDPPELREDLKQEIFMVLFYMDESRIIDMHEKGYLKFFLIRTMLNMIKSDRSTFYKNYRNLFSMTDYSLRSDILETYDISENTPHIDTVVKRWHKESVIEDKDTVITIDMKMVDEIFGLSNSGLYERDMFLLYAYIFERNAKELSRATKIPYQTVVRTLKIAREKLKTHIRCSQQ